MKRHVMIDLETLSTGFDSVVASIGAVDFGFGIDPLGDGFESLICVDSSASAGFKMDCETVAWWEKQSPEARKQLDGNMDVREALVSFADWLGGLCAKDDLFVWGNGPTFDLAILSQHFKHLGVELPWNFRNERCVRTQVAVGRAMGIDPKKTLEFIGVPHSALDDAKHQARYVADIENHLIALVARDAAVERYLNQVCTKSA